VNGRRMNIDFLMELDFAKKNVLLHSLL